MSGPVARASARRSGRERRRSRQPPDETLARQRALYIVALALVLLALLVRQPLLVVAGLLLGTLAVVPEIWYRFGLLGVVIDRGPAVRQALFGDVVEVPLTVENRQPLPLPWMEVADDFPQPLPITGARALPSAAEARVTVRSVLGLWAYQRVRLRVRCVARGVFRFGPATVRISDPFGILTREERLPQTALLLVYPLVVPIARFGLPARAPFGERKAAQRLLDDPLRVAGVRPYMPGDEPRRIHWKATARLGALQSKIYDPSTRHTLAVFMDVRTFDRAVYGYDPELVELAITTAASVASWALDQGFAVGVYANGVLAAPELDERLAERIGAADGQAPGEPGAARPPATAASGGEPQTAGEQFQRALRIGTLRLRVPPASNPAQLPRALEGLARLLPYGGLPLEEIVAREQGRLPLGASVVYIGAEPAVDVPLLVALRRMQASGHAVTMLLTGDTAADQTLNLAGLTVHRLGGRELWRTFVAEALGQRAAGDADGRTEPEHAGATRARGLVVE